MSLVEGMEVFLEDNNLTDISLARIPNGRDTNQMGNDWRQTACITPGGPNMQCNP